MWRRDRLEKYTDYEVRFHCAGGAGIFREEVWIDEHSRVVRYNLAFILPHLFNLDHGRVLGYDNAHGTHERHFLGRVEAFAFKSYPETVSQFSREMQALRREYEGQDLYRRT